MSDNALVILADNMNRLISRSGGVYSSNEAAQKASQGKVSRSTFDRLRNLDKLGATAVGVDKLEGVAKTFGLEVWQLFVPNLDIKRPPQISTERTPPSDFQQWPLELVDLEKLASLSRTDVARLEAAIVLAAAQLGIDVKNEQPPKRPGEAPPKG